MPGQAVVTINEDQWNVLVANTYTELVTGLSGREAIPAGTGMLFVLGEKRPVTVDTSQMNFALDIIFISESLVVDVASDIQPGYLVTEETPCEMFLEVNAGEASGVEVGDAVTTATIQQPGVDFSQIVTFAIPLAVLGFVCAMAGGMARLMGGSSSSPKQLSRGSAHHSEITPEEWHYAEGMWEVTKEDAERGEVASVYLWNLLNKYYPDNKDKQIRFMGFMNEVQTKYGARIPREEAWKLATKWDVEKMLARELMEYLPYLAKSAEEETIFFNVPEAREHLIKKGFVYTLRPKLRRTGKDTAYYGSYYKKERITDVEVEFIKEITTPSDLEPYLSGSGFKSVEDWWRAAEGSGFLFKVTKLPELEDNVEVYTSEVLPLDVAQGAGLHRDPQVEFRYTTYYYGPDLGLFQRDLQRLLRERTSNPNLVLDAYYIRPSPSRHHSPWLTPEQREHRGEKLPQTNPGKFEAGEIVNFKGERVRVLEHIGDRVSIWVPSRQEEAWVKPKSLKKISKEGSVVAGVEEGK